MYYYDHENDIWWEPGPPPLTRRQRMRERLWTILAGTAQAVVAMTVAIVIGTVVVGVPFVTLALIAQALDHAFPRYVYLDTVLSPEELEEFEEYIRACQEPDSRDETCPIVVRYDLDR